MSKPKVESLIESVQETSIVHRDTFPMGVNYISQKSMSFVSKNDLQALKSIPILPCPFCGSRVIVKVSTWNEIFDAGGTYYCNGLFAAYCKVYCFRSAKYYQKSDKNDLRCKQKAIYLTQFIDRINQRYTVSVSMDNQKDSQ